MEQGQKIYSKEDDVNFRKQSENVDGTQKMKAGQELFVVDGPWWRVTKDGQQGWVREDYLSNEQIVSPVIKQSLTFVKNQANLADSEITKKVREIIKDALNGAKNGYALQCTEYVQYRIKDKLGIDIKWPVTSGRNGGIWWKIFQNAGIYKILSEPKVNCAMCFIEVKRTDGTLTNEGHIAFVEELLIDGSLKISEANWPKNGIYNEREISKNDWQNKYKAKFIDFT